MTLREFKEKYGSGADAVIDPLAAVVGGKKDKVPKPSAARPPLPSKQPGNHSNTFHFISVLIITQKKIQKGLFWQWIMGDKLISLN